MRFVLFSLLLSLALLGCSPSKDDPTANGTSETSSSTASPLQASFQSGTEATEWLMNTKHTLRGLNPEDTRVLLEDLISGGAVEMRVDDIQPDPADASYKSAGRMIIKTPSGPHERKALIEFAAQKNGDPAPTKFDAEYIEIRFGQ